MRKKKIVAIKMNDLLKKFLLLLVCITCTELTIAQDQPNIVVILVDDAGNNDWGFQGSTVSITPAIDVLAKQGTIFTQGYVTNSVCSPSRAGMLTGQYQNKFGFEYNIVEYSIAPDHIDDDVGLDPSVLTMGNHLQNLGYSTALFGKWHIGEEFHHHPNERGFDHFYGLLGGSRDYNKRETTPDKQLRRNNVIVEPADDNFYVTDLLTDEALTYITSQVDADQPFLAFMSYTAPHSPWQAKPEDKALFENIEGLSDQQQEYYGMIKSVDDNVQRIVDLLQQKDEFNNTLFVFLSDNGGVSITDNGVLRGNKSSKYEGGLRVPFFATWVDGIPSNATYNNQVISLDLATTFIKVAGGDLSENHYAELDGKDLITAANAGGTLHDRLYWRKKDTWSIVSDGSNKVIFDVDANDFTHYDTLLYNLDTDISESSDLYQNNKASVQLLISDYVAWDATMDLPSWIGSQYILPRICGSVTDAQQCQVLIDQYAAFAENTQLTESVKSILIVGEGESKEISQSVLEYTDPIKSAALITYIIDKMPKQGILTKSGINLKEGDSFSQLDINTGQIEYDHNGSINGLDSIQFDVNDGSGNETINDVVLSISMEEQVKGTKYYVSTSGDDTNDGLTETTPWQTLEKVSNANLQPGDKVVFKRGDTFVGQLNPSYSGKADSVITFTAYGSGSKPIINGSGGAGGDHFSAIMINNQEYFKISYLEIQNERLVSREGVDDKHAYGIYVHNDGNEIMHDIDMSYLTVRNIFAITVEGVEFNKIKMAGICFRSEKNTVQGLEKHIKGVRLDSSYFTMIGKFGFWSQHAGGDDGIGNDSLNRNMNIVLTNNHFYHTGGSGIVPGKTYNGLVENNIFDYPGSSIDARMAARGSGAWFFNCRNIVAQYNKSFHARGNNDSYGMHIDFNNEYVLLQYNYSEDNQGFVEILGNNLHATYRFNVSVNDGRRENKGNVFWFSDFAGTGNKINSDSIWVYNNTVYVGQIPEGDYLRPGLQLTADDALIANNAIYVVQGAHLGFKQFDRTATVQVDHNLYYGNVRNENFVDQDANAQSSNPLYLNPGVLNDPDAYKLEETSPALRTGRAIEEPLFPMAGKGIFKNFSEKANLDYYGNSVDLSQPGTNIGAYNGAGEPTQGNNIPIDEEGPVYEAENATLLGSVTITECNQASEDEMVIGLSEGSSNSVTFTVFVEDSGDYDITISYQAVKSTSITYDINNVVEETLSIPATDDKLCDEGGVPGDFVFTISLEEGDNTIMFYNAPNLDKIAIERAPPVLANNQNQIEEIFQFYPNQLVRGKTLMIEANSTLRGKVKIAKLKVTNLSGRTIDDVEFYTNKTFEWNSSDLVSGIYLFTIIIEKEMITKRVIIQD
ncbi:MAG: sulfatase-like hydrolase/transferase [Reichenbachiella sp.]